METDQGPADALNKAFHQARGTLIGWLNADDLYSPGALGRAVDALEANPEWLMVYGEGEELDSRNYQRRRYPTYQPHVGLEGFRSHCFICQPTVLFRRSMAVLLGPFDLHWRTAFDFDYWLRAFEAFPNRIGYIPDLQAVTRIHADTITSRQRSRVALEATELLARQFGIAPPTRLHGYALELQLGIAELPSGIPMTQHLADIFKQAEPWLHPVDLAQLRREWLLDSTTAQAQRAAEASAAARHLHHLPSVQLLQLVEPHLRPEHPGPPAGPHSRLQAAVDSLQLNFPLLQQDDTVRDRITTGHTSQASLLHPFGVNLIISCAAPFENQLWVTTLRTRLQEAGVPAVLRAPSTEGGPYSINLVCLSPTQHASWLLEAGLAPFIGRLTLAAWPWVGDRWPKAWAPLLSLVDGILSHTSAQHDALAAALATARKQPPLELLPCETPLPESLRLCAPRDRKSGRQRHQLPADGVLIAISSDLQSPTSLVNSFGAIESFRQAFPPSDRIHNEATRPHLVVLLKNSHDSNASADQEWQWLHACCRHDSHLHLRHIDTWPITRVCHLIGSCDVWLSLRRGHSLASELMTALHLGLQVVATADDTASELPSCSDLHLVSSRKVPIPRGSLPEAGELHWVEPDRDAAAALLRSVAAELTA